MSEKEIVFMTLGIRKSYQETTRQYIQSIDDLKNIIKETKYPETANFFNINVSKTTYIYDPKDVVKKDDLEAFYVNDCLCVPGKLHICKKKTNSSQKEKSLQEQEELSLQELVVYLYELSDVYYRVLPKTTSDFNLVVTDKLQYISDIKEQFSNKYVTPPSKPFADWLTGRRYQFDPTKPCAWYTLKERFHDRDVYLRELGDEIVVDRNANQIWPTQTQQLPVGLIQMFDKSTEKTR